MSSVYFPWTLGLHFSLLRMSSSFHSKHRMYCKKKNQMNQMLSEFQYNTFCNLCICKRICLIYCTVGILSNLFILPAASQKLILTIKDFDKCRSLTVQSLFPPYMIKNTGSLAPKGNWLRYILQHAPGGHKLRLDDLVGPFQPCVILWGARGCWGCLLHTSAGLF